jgi:hypothetical protein
MKLKADYSDWLISIANLGVTYNSQGLMGLGRWIIARRGWKPTIQTR